MLRALVVSLVLGSASLAHAQLVVRAEPASSPTHGGEWVALQAVLHVTNPTSRPIVLRGGALELIDPGGVVQRVEHVLVARRGGNARRSITIAPGEHVDVSITSAADAHVDIAYHVAYRQVIELLVDGRAQRTETPGVFEFRPYRDAWY